jgi:hypothetical protein
MPAGAPPRPVDHDVNCNSFMVGVSLVSTDAQRQYSERHDFFASMGAVRWLHREVDSAEYRAAASPL